MGRGKRRLFHALRHIVERYDPAAVFVYNTCVPTMERDDIDAVFRQLLQVGMRAVRVPPETSIAQLLQQIQQCWADSEQSSRRRQRDPNRFVHVLAETEWQDEDDAC